jgi:hypothetical protein
MELKFQFLSPRCFLTHSTFNYFSAHYLKVNFKDKNFFPIIFNIFLKCTYDYIFVSFFQNTEFSHILKSELLNLYNTSWIGLYFGYKGIVLEPNSVVVFGNPETQTPTKNSRFYVNVWFKSKLSQLYFLPEEIWKTLPPSLKSDNLVYLVDTISNVTHGMPSNGFAYTKSPFYKAPFKLRFKTNIGIEPNLLIFNDFFIPNSYDTVLSLLAYNDDSDQFVAQYDFNIVLQDNYTSVLPNMLEFEICDSEQKRVEFMDKSQLYLSFEPLEVLEKKQ